MQPNGPLDSASDEAKLQRKLTTKKSGSQKHGQNNQVTSGFSRNTGQLVIQNTAQPNVHDTFGNLNAHFNQNSTQQIGKMTKGITPSQQNISKMLQKTTNQTSKENNQFTSPNVGKKYIVQTQSQQQLPGQKNSQQKMILTAGGPNVHNQEMLIDNQNSTQYQNYNSLKQAGITKQNILGNQVQKSQSNSRITQAQLQNQQKFLAQTTKSKAGNITNVGKSATNLSNQKQATAYHGFNKSRLESQNSRNNDLSEEYKNQRQEQNCYTDEELQMINRKEFQKTNPTSIKRTGSSRQQRRVKASTTKGQEIHTNEEVMNSYINTNDQNKSLYTNISLREISQSPDQRNSGMNSGKLNVKNGQTQQKKGNIQNNHYIQKNIQQQQRNHSSQDQIHPMDANQKSSGSVVNIQNQIDLQNQMQLKNYLNQLNPNQQKADKNNSVLNIKTVQDINIYNNSFIVNSTNLPPGFQAQQVSQAQVIQETFNSSGQTLTTGKKALKLRKELSGLQSNLTQARSVSQGRLNNNNRGISTGSANNTSVGQTRNHPGGLTEYNSYGALHTNPSQLSKLSKAYDNYNQNIRTQNIQNLQQNPNQKRVLNPPNKMFGNLSALSDIQKKHSLSNKQSNYQNVYSNNASTGKPQNINKMIKNMISSNTSRHASRADSRQGGRGINSKTTDQKILQANLNNIAIQDGSVKNQTNNSSIQQMKINYLSNQKIMISNQNHKGDHLRPVTQIEHANPAHFFMDKGISDGVLSHHNSSQNVKSQQYQNAVNNYIQNKNINSYELRKHSLQDIKMRGINNESAVHKFKNQIQNLSSDLDRERITMLATQENGMINSMSLQNQQQFFKTSKGPINRNKTQDAKSQKILNTGDKSKESLNRKVNNEFLEQHKTLSATFHKIQKSCQEIQPQNKEEIMKFNLKYIENLQIKISGVKKQLSLQGQTLQLEQVTELFIKLNQETITLKALCHLDIGQNYECVQELKKIQEVKNATSGAGIGIGENAENTLSSDALLAANFASGSLSKYINGDINKSQVLKNALIFMSIAQHRMGEHQQSIDTVTQCIGLYPEFKDAYLVRGQKYLLSKKLQISLQDLIKFDQMISSELAEAQIGQQANQQKLHYLMFQVCIAKESMGDVYKKMKRYKQASKCYQDSLNELQKLLKNKNSEFYKKQSEKCVHFTFKLKQKLGMCCYYQGQIKKAILTFDELIKYYNKFDPTLVRVQQKTIKYNFYYAKSMLSANERDTTNNVEYLQALTKLTYCTNEEIDPELHELYSGNAHFEVFKIFIKQKDIYNAHEYLQKATDNNFNSKRLSLYRDFTEGVVYLMKRKIKKGVQILTDLLEVLINGHKEIEKKNKAAEDAKNEKEIASKTRYNVQESGDQFQPIESGVDLNATETVDKSTINSKANQIASGRFTKEMYDFLILNIYVYRSYGYVAIEKYEHALEDLKKAKKINPKYIDRSTIYNKWLSRGILKMDTEEYLMASRYFGKASLRFPNNKDSFCLNVISIVRSYSFSLMNHFMDNSQKYDKVIQTRKFLDIAIDCCCIEQKQPSLYFFRGLLNYQLHHFYEALNDFNVAIAEEEEPTGQFHLARGRCYACLSILDEAMKDLSIALELDDTLHEAYIFRGKCAYLLGDNNLAFHDFQKLIISDQKNPLVHIYAGNLLMTTGAYADAIKAFDNADTVQQTPLSSFQRIRCFCALSNLEGAFEQMQLAMHQAPNEKFMNYDFKILLQLLSVVRSFAFSKGENNEPDENGIKEQSKIIQNCIQQISQTITQFENNEHMEHKKEHSPMTIQIIPNVNRIKVEKNLVLKKLQPHQEGIPQYTPLSKSELKELEGIPFHGYYRENIFSLEEMYLYRAVFNVYNKNYKIALVDLDKAWKQHFTQKREAAGKKIIDTDSDNMYGKFPMSQLVSPIESLRSNSQKTDLSEVGLCSLNIGEYSLNQMIIQIQLGDFEKALQKANEVLTTAPQNNEFSKSIKQLLLVRAMIFQELGQTDKQNQDMTLYLKNFGQISKNKHNAVLVEPFESKGRICNQFDPIVLNFKKKTKGSFELWMRPSFSMPFIKPPNMIPNINEDIVQSEFNLKQIDAPMPEAPWIRFCVEREKFQPQEYVYQLSPRWTQKKTELETLPKLPDIVGNQKFVATYNNRENMLFYDDKVMEDIDDLSDTEKVSLISDIEVNDEPTSVGSDNKNGISGLSGLTFDKSVTNDDLHIASVEKLELDKEKIISNNNKKVNRVNNGIQLCKSKQLCGHQRVCGSCYDIQADPMLVNITNQEQLIDYLSMSHEEQEKQRRINIAQALAQISSKGPATGKEKALGEDTVSEEEYGSSEDEATKESGKKKGKDSKYTHSRFSSQIADDLDEMNVMMGEMNINEDADIEETEIQINHKKLNTDKRNILKKADDKKINLPMKFQDDIDSIQNRADTHEFIENTDGMLTSPHPKNKPVKGVQKSTNQKPEGQEKHDDDIVLMGSKNVPKITKKKTDGKSLGIANLNVHTLKKNKLAIAFNNLEMDKDDSKDKDSDSK